MSTTTSILVVDDDRDNRESLAKLLEIHGFAAEMAPDGESALAKVKAKPPDVIILDLVMPELSGFDVLARLNSDGRTKEIPVICLTGWSDARERALKLGCVEYLLKPAKPKDVLSAVGRVADRARSV